MKRIILLITVSLNYSCQDTVIDNNDHFIESISSIPEYAQRESGDPVKGKNYLLYGDYISSGFPYDFFLSNFPSTTENALNRSGNSAVIPFSFNAVKARNGIDIVAPNCFQCHAQYLNGEFMLGLGNYDSDYTFDQSLTLTFSDQAIASEYGNPSLEWSAYEPFSKASKVVAPYLVTEVKGVNPADKLTAVLGAHRNPENLEWVEEALYDIPAGLIPTDVPALWLMKKKNALYYTGSGRGDHARLITLAEILTMPDTAKAREVDHDFTDVYAFLESIEPPLFPESIDSEKASKGEMLYNDHCAKCHGADIYPNYLVDVDYVGTDPELAKANFAYVDFLNWYNGSWYNQGINKAYFEKTEGYVAPPLDGIWATAPYLHNGSVPDLESLLNSATRPEYWKRRETYNMEKVGWDYIVYSATAGTTIYDTKKKGYSNKGHSYGDVFNATERSQIIEYLKTL
ncbi:c-type cytochrome [Portibacter lacus]|uniref:Cytochrome c domain-containing protein n=1 Tax=Portibacter lacus TaxID=1099794 RepID=A0AA37SSJ6_9BACT|nr:hypothetical protein [Portibacter lacus]GLR19222.1 hypothetical protein GCM10007940_38380 [Portibacter lacus]